MADVNEYEIAGRQRKANALVAVFQSSEKTSAEVATMPDEEWEMAMKATALTTWKVPSADTKALVKMLRQLEERAVLREETPEQEANRKKWQWDGEGKEPW